MKDKTADTSLRRDPDISLLIWEDNTLGALFTAAVSEDLADEALALLKERGIQADKIHVPERRDRWVLRVEDAPRFRTEFPDVEIGVKSLRSLVLDNTDLLNTHRV